MSEDRSKDYVSEKGNGPKVLIIAGIVILALLIAFAIYAFLTPGYMSQKQVLNNYYKAVSKEDARLYKKCCYTSKWSKGYTQDSVKGNNLDQIIADAFTMQSGATYSDVEIISQESLDDRYADSMMENVESLYGIKIKVSKISKVNFTVNYTLGGVDDKTGTLTRYCYKSGGKWYFLSDTDVIISMMLEEN
ncbi:MAG: hypothetical protein K6E10_01710 [Eubacterium sp.]|nr:hypothetical protein [Eubacterium sp.]